MRPTVVSISGFSSEVGKTSLLCDLLSTHPGWEAIKVTKGHYRSCGKDPEACCVSHLLGERPLVFSGRDQTYKPGKDTGRYWEAGASNVHWVVGTDQQIWDGVEQALNKVEASGVFVEGTSFLKRIPVDFSLMVAMPPFKEIKSSAVAAMAGIGGIFLTGVSNESSVAVQFWDCVKKRGGSQRELPFFFREDIGKLGQLIDLIHENAGLS